MIRLLIKLIVAGLIANTAWRVGSEYVTFYRFEDAVRNTATFRKGTDDDLRRRVEELSSQFDIPLSDDALTILSNDSHTVIEGSYVKPIAMLPGYEYPWNFSWTVDAIHSNRF